MALVKEGAIIAGRYRLERTLARGGMGSVWVARHLQLDAEVAIKFIAPEYASSSEALARFEREAKASAQLRTPNVVQVYDYGVEDGTPYIAMELLDGEDLGARLQREGRLAPAALLIIMNQLCKALRRAHEVGLVHRDLKPANIFLARQDDEEIVKILDFGIAKATGLGLAGYTTKTGTLLGSPYYMSPEQVRRSKAVDHRSDLWSLGVIIFQCLTGRLPFRGEDLGEVIMEICSENIPLASHVAPGLGPEVDRLLARALARDPEERFQSAQELAGAFAAMVSSLGAEAGATQMAPPAEGASPSRVALPAASSTLSPTGNSLVEPPNRGRRIGILLALLASALLVGIIAVRALRALAPSAAPTPPLDQAASPPSATGAAAPTASSAAPPVATSPAATPPAATSPAATPSASASAAAPGSASATAPPPRKPPPVQRGTPPPRKPKIPDDPTDHM